MSDLITKITLTLLQSILILGISPLVIGYIRKVKAKMQSRTGSSVFQPYRDLYKLIRKDTVASSVTSFVFLFVPFVLVGIVVFLSAVIPAISIVPADSQNMFLYGAIDIIAVIYIFGLYTFMLVLSAFDTGSSFGGLGGARDYMFSVICEPIIFGTFLIQAMIVHSTQFSVVVTGITSETNTNTIAISIIALVAFFIALLAENARFPFDNPATHLELTMVHEAMILEYSGKHLAMIEFSAWVKLVLFFTIASSLFVPWGINTSTDMQLGGLLLGLVTYLLKIFAFATVVALIESLIAKLRIFKLPTLLGFAFILVLMSLIYLTVFVK